jgi:HPt (histidine-containing phosphotransfer) domain-containing protein
LYERRPALKMPRPRSINSRPRPSGNPTALEVGVLTASTCCRHPPAERQRRLRERRFGLIHEDKMPAVLAGEVSDQAPVRGHRAGPLIDPQAIERLRELDPGGRHGVLPRVLKAYETSLARHLVDIGSARDAADMDRMLRAVHTLKSSSAAVGAMGFSQRCADIEHGVRAGKTMPDAAQVDALVEEGQAVLAAVGAMLAP